MTQYNPLVSIIIPMYNRAHTISDAVNSVMAQTYDNYEVILVDDGSTDNTKEIITRDFDAVTYIYQENCGPSVARNTGIKHAKGELIAFLDSDDAWLPFKLEKQLQCLAEQPDLGMIGTDYFNCDENLGNPIRQAHLKFARTEREEILIRNLWPTPSLLIRRSCFDAVGLFNEEMRFAEDWDMWIRIAQSYPVATINEPLVLIRKHRQSLAGSVGNSDYNYELWKKLILSNRQRFPRMSFVAYHKAMSFYFFNRSYDCQVKSDARGERRFLLKSLLYWPFFIPKRAAVLMVKYLKMFKN